jgi:hypothetical protein
MLVPVLVNDKVQLHLILWLNLLQVKPQVPRQLMQGANKAAPLL